MPRLVILPTNLLAETARQRGNTLQTQPGPGGAGRVKRESQSGGTGSRGSVTCQGCPTSLARGYVYGVLWCTQASKCFKKGSVHTSGLPVRSRMSLSA